LTDGKPQAQFVYVYTELCQPQN